MEFKVIKTIYFSNSENNTGRDEEFEIQQDPIKKYLHVQI